MKRVVQPEWLDRLAPEDPAARASRRDLRRINAWMGNEAWIGSVLRREAFGAGSVLELGAGDGALAKYVRQHLARPLSWTGLDFAPCPDEWEGGWMQGDLLEMPWPGTDVVVANLVLHHFTDEQLVRIGERLPDAARLLVFNEPARRRRHIWQTFLLPLTGAHAVTRHDAPVSVCAGFAADELAGVLGLDAKRWLWETHLTLWGAYRLVARRR